MKIKRFYAQDMRSAILKVREELGPDAVILSNNRVNGGMEIVAAIDYDESLVHQFVGPSAPDLTPREDRNKVLDDLRYSRNIQASAKTTETPTTRKKPESKKTSEPRDSGNIWSQEPTLLNMQNELKTLRSLLVDQLSGLAWNEASRQHPLRTRMLKRLIALGINPAMARQMVEHVDEKADVEHNWRSLLGQLAHRLQVTNDDIMNDGGVVALVGPTGVGKTTTIAKLAARYMLRHGAGRVAVISTDCYRIAAHEQLRTFARILGVPMHVAKDGESLEQALKLVADKELVLIDTAGMSQRDSRLVEQINMFRSVTAKIRTYLVLAANTQRSVLEEVLETCRAIKASGCIVTKVDETTSLGGVLSVAIENNLPLAYIADGQRVPEDIHVARAHSLVSRGVAIMQEAGQRHKNENTNMTISGMVAHAHG